MKPATRLSFPARPAPAQHDDPVCFVIPYTHPSITREALAAAASLTGGLSARVLVAAVHVVPFPADLHFPELVRIHLEARLAELAAESPVAVEPVVVLARSEEEGIACIAPRGATVIIGARKRLWPTRERRLALRLKRSGHSVAVLDLGGKS